MTDRRRIVRYIAVEEAAEVDFGDSGIPGITGAHKFIGYQAAPPNPRARNDYAPHGWLVFLVNEDVSAGHPRRLRRQSAEARTAIRERGAYHLSPETRAKISRAHLARAARIRAWRESNGVPA